MRGHTGRFDDDKKAGQAGKKSVKEGKPIKISVLEVIWWDGGALGVSGRIEGRHAHLGDLRPTQSSAPPLSLPGYTVLKFYALLFYTVLYL